MSDSTISQRHVIKAEYEGHDPDIRLKVFDDQEYHVHSIVLKQQSAFFRKFLDSPDKKGRVSNTAFSYEWVTKIDEDDGSWSLIAACSEPGLLDLTKLKEGATSKIQEETVFGKLICAIYDNPYQFDDYLQVIALVNLADYYCALPAVSRTIDKALLTRPYISMDYDLDDVDLNDLFPIAAKVRSALLFRECLVHLCAHWKNPRLKDLRDQKLRKTAQRAYDGICFKVAKAQEVITSELKQTRMISPNSEQTLKLEKIVKDAERGLTRYPDDVFVYPVYFLMIHRYDKEADLYGEELISLIKSNLVFDKWGGLETHYWLEEECFYCAEIDDEDLPWDSTQTDW